MDRGPSIKEYAVELMRPGETSISNLAVLQLTTVTLSFVIVLTNIIGAAAVLAILVFNVVPEPHLTHLGAIHLFNGLATAVYLAFSLPVGYLLGVRSLRQCRDWLMADRPPTAAEARVLLIAPARLFVIQLVLWLIAAGVFSALNAHYSSKFAVSIAIVVSLTGFVTAACAYLGTERLLRSAAARALRGGERQRVAVPGVATRTLLAWGLGTALPVAGLASVGILALTGDPTIKVHNLGVSVVTLAATAITVGLIAVTLAARTTADPIRSVARALAQVQRGDFEIRVPVYDGSQIGQLQLGFNQMVEGLAERERIREAFGTYVDPEVAAHILDEGVDMAGEQVDVTCLFLDVRDFTGFAERNSAPQVVAALNRLFDRVVPIIHAHGGRIDKFVGDGLLAVFGAPRRFPDHADRALAASREIERAVATDPDLGLPIGIGLNSGPVVAGNVGGSGRFEFSVVGDAVNVAARVEAATRQTGDVLLISEHTLAAITGPTPDVIERAGVTLKGKSAPVRVFTPAD